MGNSTLKIDQQHKEIKTVNYHNADPGLQHVSSDFLNSFLLIVFFFF